VRADCHRFGWQDVASPVAMVGVEFRFPVECVYRSLIDHPLYRPAPRCSLTSAAAPAAVDPARFPLPERTRAHAEVVSFHHRCCWATTMRSAT
jgi:hypothetical protein